MSGQAATDWRDEDWDEGDEREYRRERAEARRAALSRSYATPAVVTMVLYLCLWLPGLVANLLYLRAARADAILARRTPHGYDALRWLLVICGILPATFALILFIASVA